MEKIKGSELIIKKEIKDTPFTIINNTEDKTYFGVIGNYRITEMYKTEAETEKELKKITWNRIIQVIQIILQIEKNTNVKT